MKFAKLFLIFLLFSGLLSFSRSTAAYGQRHIDTIKLKKQIDSLMLPLVKDNLLSGTVLIAVNDAIVFQKAYGMANREERHANTADTKFAIASVTKMFTALAIMQLVESGKLDLQDKLIRYLPDFPPGEKITIFHLLTHTSGLPSYVARENRFVDFTGVIGLIKALSLKFEPGANFEYSNSGFALLAYIIEKVSGQAYEDYLQHHVFTPAGMGQSGMIPNEPDTTIGGLARGYSLNESGGLELSEKRGPAGKGDGALFSTAGDMHKFNRALFGGKLVSPKTRERMFQPFKQSHALGCIVEDHRGWKVVHHPGGTQGVRTNFKTFIDQKNKVTVVNLFNTDFMLSHLVDEQIEKIALGEPWKPVFQPDKSWIDSFKKFAGTYEIAPDDIFKITIENNQLFYHDHKQKKYAAFPFSETSFFIKGLNSRYHFALDKKTGGITFVGFIGTAQGAFMVEGKQTKNQ